MLNTEPAGTKPDAKPGTNAACVTAPEPMAHADTAVILRVLDRHGLSQAWLARACNLSPSYVSRIVSGEYPVPHDMVRRVFDVTGDSELLDLFSAGSARYRVLVIDRQASFAASLRPVDSVTQALAILAMAQTGDRGGPEWREKVVAATQLLVGAVDGLPVVPPAPATSQAARRGPMDRTLDVKA